MHEIVLVTERQGIIEQRLRELLMERGIAVRTIDVRAECLVPGSFGVVLLEDPYEAYVVSSAFEYSINPRRVFECGVNRALFFETLRKIGIRVPHYFIVKSPEGASSMARSLNGVCMLTQSEALGLDGIVENWFAVKSIAEHRLYSCNPLVKISIITEKPKAIKRTRIIMGKCIGCGDLEDVAIKAAQALGCVICTLSFGIFEDGVKALGIDPRVNPTQDELQLLVEAIIEVLRR